MHLIVVVPCFNEEHRLPVEEFERFRLEGARVEFCFVNDGSRDGTLRLLESIAAADPSAVLRAEPGAESREGRGRAARDAGGVERRHRTSSDSGTPTWPRRSIEISEFMKCSSARPEIEMVFAARVRLLGRSISRNPRRHYVGRVGATLISSSLGLAVYDTQCGAKLFRVERLDAQTSSSTPFLSRWIFDVEIIARFAQQRTRRRRRKRDLRAADHGLARRQGIEGQARPIFSARSRTSGRSIALTIAADDRRRPPTAQRPVPFHPRPGDDGIRSSQDRRRSPRAETGRPLGADLTVGDFSPAEFRIPAGLEALIAENLAAAQTNYPPSDGTLELRRVSARAFPRASSSSSIPSSRRSSPADRDRSSIAAYAATVDRGDKVIYPTPSWNNNHYTYLSGGVPVELVVGAETNFMPTAEMIRPHVRDAR